MLAPNGVRVLRHLGVGDAIDRLGSPIADLITSRADGIEITNVGRSTPGGDPREQFGIHRAGLFELRESELLHDLDAVACAEESADVLGGAGDPGNPARRAPGLDQPDAGVK